MPGVVEMSIIIYFIRFLCLASAATAREVPVLPGPMSFILESLTDSFYLSLYYIYIIYNYTYFHNIIGGRGQGDGGQLDCYLDAGISIISIWKGM